MDEIQQINHLCRQVNLISKKHDEIARLTGENFNIFQVLRMETDEVRLHSRLIGDLLNPKGSHGLGSLFLEMFLKQVKVFPDEQFGNPSDFNVQVEKYVGEVNKETLVGGSIDIIIESKEGRNIIIENKIYAGDQPGQLRRYYNYDKNAKILYLTLRGDDPSEDSTRNNCFHDSIICPQLISYEEHILSWLNDCIKETVNFPRIRETINQYINSLRNLTGQSMSNKMDEEIINEIIKSKDSIDATIKIAALKDGMILKLIGNLKPELKNIAESQMLQLTFDPELGRPDTQFYFQSDNWNHFCILFYFGGSSNNLGSELGFGIYPKIRNEINQDLKAKLIDFNPWNNRITKGYGNWYWVAKLEEWNRAPWNSLKDVIPHIEEKVKALQQKMNEIEFGE